MSQGINADDSSHKADATIAFILSSLMEHERSLDKLIGGLNELKLKAENKKQALNCRLEKLDITVNNLETEVQRLICSLNLSNGN